MTEPIEVRLLDRDDDRSAFACGDVDLDRFFHRYAGQNQFRHHVGATYVAVAAGRVLGYVTVSAAHIEIENLPASRRRKLPHYPLPVLRLARLAVDRLAQGKGVGKLLLRAVLDLAHEMAGSVGCVAVVVDAKPAAVEFYRRYGFEPLEAVEGNLSSRPEPVPMVLPLASIPTRRP